MIITHQEEKKGTEGRFQAQEDRDRDEKMFEMDRAYYTTDRSFCFKFEFLMTPNQRDILLMRLSEGY